MGALTGPFVMRAARFWAAGHQPCPEELLAGCRAAAPGPIPRRRRPLFGALGLVFLLACWAGAGGAGCATARDGHYRALTRAMQQHQPAQAQRLLSDAQGRLYTGVDALLLPMDRAMVALSAGDWPGCIAACEAAKALIEQLYTQHVRDRVASYILGDDRLPYVGDPYERVAVHLIEALAYLAQGDVAEARVEVRAMQATLQRQAEGQDKEKASGGASISDNAFAYFLAGLLEADEPDRMSRDDDAALDLQRALRLYEAPEGRPFGMRAPAALVQALCRVLQRQGKQVEACALQARLPGQAGDACCQKGPARSPPPASGKVIILHLAGEVPAKAEAAWEAYTGLQVLRVPYPYYGRPQVPSARLRARLHPPRDAAEPDDGPRLQPAEQVFDLGLTAQKTLADHMHAIHDRAVARAVAAAVATDALLVGGAIQGGVAGDVMQLVGLGLGITHAATVRADLRSWRTLPNTVELAVLHAPLGPAELTLEVASPQGGKPWQQHQQLVVSQSPTFVVLRSL